MSKKLKCFCNDDTMCPLHEVVADGKRFCESETVCITKRYLTADQLEFNKYFCDDAFAGSVRKTIINYRDCKVNTNNKADLEHVLENSAEYCCDDGDFCNEFLKPKRFIRYMSFENDQDKNSLINDGKSNGTNLIPATIFTTTNIVFLILLGILALFLIILAVYTIVVKFKMKNKKNLSSLSSTTSGALSTTSSKSKSTTVSTSTKATTVLTQLSEKSFNPIVNDNTTNNNNNSRPKSKVNRESYLNNELIAPREIIEPLIPKTIPIENTELPKFINFKENSFPLTLGSDFCTTSECYTNGTNSSQNPNNGFEWSGSGSGAGVPELLQRTIARQIKLIYPCIGKGRFGEVYKGMWRDEFIAVKTFNSADEKSWQNECSIYNTSGFRHENILGFIASDNIDRGTYTELWIITEYHDNGSLFDYLNLVNLKQRPLDTLRMVLSIVNGLDHLHTAIESCTGKPALAHCDLKSKNILVKADLTCCISDLGLALCGDKNGNVTEDPFDIRTGTKRYMAPEILSKTINYKSLLQFQKAEMYSLALIFWELLRRTSFELNEQTYTYEYRLPYNEYIQSDPDDTQMKLLVCDQKKRPEINQLWRDVPILNELTHLTEELWVENADGRLNALRLKKSINLIKKKHCI